MGIGPIPAVARLFQRTGLDWKDIDLLEINEAFACQVLALLKLWGWSENVRARLPDTSLVPPIALQGTASLAGQQAAFDARVTAGGSTNLTLKGQATLPQGRAALAGNATIGGTADIAPFAPLAGNSIRGLSGTLRPNLTFEIAGSRVTGSGTVDLSNAALAMPEAGLRLGNGEARLALQGDTVQIQRFTFQTGRSGAVTARQGWRKAESRSERKPWKKRHCETARRNVPISG